MRDKDVQDKLKELLELEIDFHSFLLGLEKEKTPREHMEFGQKALQRLKIDWKDWIKEIVKKLNSLIFKLITPSPGS